MRRTALSIGIVVAVAASLFAAAPAASAIDGRTATGNEVLSTLTVASENRAGYDRELFKHWIDSDNDGCDTRAEVLLRDTLDNVWTENGCTVTTGSWWSRFDNQTWSNASDVDIDHLVPLAEAWDSGASTWTPDRRQAFANDLDYKYSLVAMTDSLNQSKSDRDPAEWMPPADQCFYAQAWVSVKARWSLSVDQAEADSLRAIFDGPGSCGYETLPLFINIVPFEGEDPKWPLFTTRYDGAIYEMVDGITPVQLSYNRWATKYNLEAPRAASTDFVKYPWSPSIYAVTFWPGGEEFWQWDHIEFDEWQRAGRPSARIAGWIQGSYYYQWATSGEIFVSGPDDRAHKLTYSEWRDSGFRQFEVLADRGLQKLSWTSDIAYMESISAGQGGPLSYSDWSEMSFPTPQVVQRFTGDQFYRYGGSADIWYAGPTMNRTINYNEWGAAGFPQPTLIGSDPTPPVVTPPVTQPPANVYYANCSAVPRHLKPILRGQPGYGSHLDRDGDGRACEV